MIMNETPDTHSNTRAARPLTQRAGRAGPATGIDAAVVLVSFTMCALRLRRAWAVLAIAANSRVRGNDWPSPWSGIEE
jgi:hypothetical protein